MTPIEVFLLVVAIGSLAWIMLIIAGESSR
jgi:hypothetical protein